MNKNKILTFFFEVMLLVFLGLAAYTPTPDFLVTALGNLARLYVYVAALWLGIVVAITFASDKIGLNLDTLFHDILYPYVDVHDIGGTGHMSERMDIAFMIVGVLMLGIAGWIFTAIAYFIMCYCDLELRATAQDWYTAHPYEAPAEASDNYCTDCKDCNHMVDGHCNDTPGDPCE